jgi:hypothetical protein
MRVAVQFDHPAHEPRKIDNNPRPDGLAGVPGSSAAREDWQGIFVGVSNTLRDIFFVPWPNDRDRSDLVEARIGRIHMRVERIAEDFSVQCPAQIGFDSRLFSIHSAIRDSFANHPWLV